MKSFIVVAVTVLAAVAKAQIQASDCATKWDEAFECVEKIKYGADTQTLNKKQDAITEKCAPNLPPQCTAVKKAGDSCQEQVSKDSSLVALRKEIKGNVSKCFEQYQSKTRRSADDPPPFAQAPPPPGAPFGGKDPCAPSDSQMLCVRFEMRKDTEAQSISEKVHKGQLDCFNDVTNDVCQVDRTPELRNCIEKAKQPFVDKAMAKMQECMQAALNSTIPPPSGP